jgi:methylmalonyl-CoA mutase N-terminal domain/subunit
VLSAALGGAQSIHANGFDEALALPTERAAKLALRTQQVIAAESGITDTVDPLGGSWYVESLTAEIENRATALIDEIDRRGGAVSCIDLMSEQIHDAAYRHQQEVTSGERTIVGINAYTEGDEVDPDLLRVDPKVEGAQVARLAELRARRDNDAVTRGLAGVRAAAKGTDNLLYPMRDALRARATVGEVCNVLRDEWGEHDRLRTTHS